MRQGSDIFQKFLRERMVSFRRSRRLSKEAFSEYLHVSPRSYAAQENEEYGFSALSLTFFPSRLEEPELEQFFQDFRSLTEEQDL